MRRASMVAVLSFAAVGAAALTAGCGAHTGVVPIGQDTLMVARQGWISTQSVGELKAEAFAAADAFCASKSKSVLPSTHEIHLARSAGMIRRLKFSFGA